MANQTDEHHYPRVREDESDVSKKPPGKTSPNYRVRGRPLRNQPSFHLSKEALLEHTTHESRQLKNSAPSRDHPQPVGNAQRNPPHWDAYRGHPRHLAYQNSVFSQNPYGQPYYPWGRFPASRAHPNGISDTASRQWFEKLLEECNDLKMFVQSLLKEKEDLEELANHQLSSLKEQLEITERQNSKLEEQAKELKKLRTKLSSLKIEVAGKNIELEKRQAEIRLGKKELEKKQAENWKGIAHLTKLKRDKKKLYEQVQSYKKKLGSYQSFQMTLQQVLENLDKQGHKIEVLVQNCKWQKIEYNQIISHFKSCYCDVHNEFRLLRDTFQEEDELKRATIDDPTGKPAIYNQTVDVLFMDVRSNFDQLETLEKTFRELSSNSCSVVSSD